MKRLLLSTALMAGLSSAALAEAPGGPGCGWGNMLFKGQSGLPAHLVASVTNGTSGNASFGMTSGTNGCSTSGTLSYSGTPMITVMLDELSEDVARGDGEALAAVAISFGVEAEDRASFKQLMHKNFNNIFSANDVTAEEVLASMHILMKQDATLAKYVS